MDEDEGEEELELEKKKGYAEEKSDEGRENWKERVRRAGEMGGRLGGTGGAAARVEGEREVGAREIKGERPRWKIAGLIFARENCFAFIWKFSKVG